LNYLTFQEAPELSNKALEDMELNAGFNKRPPQPTYNPVKGIVWSVKNWPEIEQYLMLGILYELGTREIENPHNKQEEEITWIDKDAFLIKISTQLGKASESGLKDEPQTPRSKGKEKEEQLQTLKKQKKDIHLPQKKKVQINPEPDLEPSSSSSNVDESEPDSDKTTNSDSEDSGSETDRSVREITPEQKEWEKVTGIN